VPNAKSNPQLVLRPQDLLVLLRLSVEGAKAEAPSYSALAADLGLTASEVHAAVTRAVAAPTRALAAVRAARGKVLLSGDERAADAGRTDRLRGGAAECADPLASQ
jgi:hypothetical protein